jgi:hypothetical protein
MVTFSTVSPKSPGLRGMGMRGGRTASQKLARLRATKDPAKTAT